MLIEGNKGLQTSLQMVAAAMQCSSVRNVVRVCMHHQNAKTSSMLKADGSMRLYTVQLPV